MMIKCFHNFSFNAIYHYKLLQWCTSVKFFSVCTLILETNKHKNVQRFTKFIHYTPSSHSLVATYVSFTEEGMDIGETSTNFFHFHNRNCICNTNAISIMFIRKSVWYKFVCSALRIKFPTPTSFSLELDRISTF